MIRELLSTSKAAVINNSRKVSVAETLLGVAGVKKLASAVNKMGQLVPREENKY